MSGEVSPDQPETALDRPETAPASRSWKRMSNAPRLPQDHAARQGAITTLAFQLLGGRDGALDFLNSANPVLGGRPLELATASQEGFAVVEQAIRQIALTEL